MGRHLLDTLRICNADLLRCDGIGEARSMASIVLVISISAKEKLPEATAPEGLHRSST